MPAPRHFVPSAAGSASKPSVIAPATSAAALQPSAIAPATSAAASQPSVIAPRPLQVPACQLMTMVLVARLRKWLMIHHLWLRLSSRSRSWISMTSNGLRPWSKKCHMRSLSMMFSAACNLMTGSVNALSWTWSLTPTVSKITFSVILRHILFASSTLQKFPWRIWHLLNANFLPGQRGRRSTHFSRMRQFASALTTRRWLKLLVLEESWRPGGFSLGKVWPQMRDRKYSKTCLKTRTQTVVNAEATKRAKARIVLLGFQHPSLPDCKFKTYAPVISSLGRTWSTQLLPYSSGNFKGWIWPQHYFRRRPQKLMTSCLPLACRSFVKHFKHLLALLWESSVTTTAPRGKTLCELGGGPTLGERCLRCWYSKHEHDPSGHGQRLIGLMGGHVDDIHRCGDQESNE